MNFSPEGGLTEIKRMFVDGRFGQIHLRIKCPGVPKCPLLLCLHMFPQSGRNFQTMMRHINDRIVVAPDFPGHGESAMPQEPIPAQEYAAAIWEAVDALDLLQTGPIEVFGVHAGAKLAVELASQRPEAVRKIVLASAAVLSPEEVERFKRVFRPMPLDEAGTRHAHLWDMQINSRGAGMTLEMCAVGFAEALRGGERYEDGHMAVFEYNSLFADVLNKLDHEILLLNPNDGLYDMTERALRYMKRGELLDLPHWEFGYLETRAEELAQIVTDWLDTNRTPIAAE